jgi:hypothetical protein
VWKTGAPEVVGEVMKVDDDLAALVANCRPAAASVSDSTMTHTGTPCKATAATIDRAETNDERGKTVTTLSSRDRNSMVPPVSCAAAMAHETEAPS